MTHVFVLETQQTNWLLLLLSLTRTGQDKLQTVNHQHEHEHELPSFSNALSVVGVVGFVVVVGGGGGGACRFVFACCSPELTTEVSKK